jgi:hypothetical protein
MISIDYRFLKNKRNKNSLFPESASKISFCGLPFILPDVLLFHCSSNASILPVELTSLSFIHSSTALQPFVGPWPLLQFLNFFYRDGRTPRTCNQSVVRRLSTTRTTRTQNKRTHSHPCLEYDSNPRSQRSKAVHAVDRAATVIGLPAYH